MLSQKYSTTQNLVHEKPVVINKNDDKFNTMLFLPENKERIYEGGLRTKGYFKKSFENKPLISIVTVVYNGEKYLEQTIKSVVEQSYDNVEYILIDGGSSDRSLEIIKKYEHCIDYIISEKDDGIYDAFNKGITLSLGEYIGIINSDDWYEKDILTLVMQSITSDKVDIVHGLINYITPDKGSFISEAIKDYEKLKKRMIIQHPTCFVRQDVYKQYGIYDSSYKIAADYELFLKFYNSKLFFHQINTVLSNMRGGGVSATNEWIRFKEVARARKNNNITRYVFRDFVRLVYKTMKNIIQKK